MTTRAALTVRRYMLGPWQTNCYVVRAAAAEAAPACWIVDAGMEPGPLIAAAREALGGKGAPEALILTHAHVDHIAGVEEVRRAFPGVRVLVHRAEAGWLGDPLLNLSAMLGPGGEVSVSPAERLLEDGEVLELGPTRWKVIHVPGHSPGGIGLWWAGGDAEAAGAGTVQPGILLGGDALFAGSIGRTDLPGGDLATLERSIRERLYALPMGTRVLPGHGHATTIGEERLTNPFVRA